MQAALRHTGRTGGHIPHIAIIGAGAAGLRCTDILARSGVQVTLFEARNRIGGRIHQESTGGFLVDMGANWIHGTNGNPMMKLAERTGTVVIEPEESGALYDTQGRRRSDAEAGDLSARIWGMVVDAFKHSDAHSATIDPQKSLYQYFQQVLDKDPSMDQKKRDDLLYEAQMWGPFVGDKVETQSLKFFFLEECIDGENVFVASTYQKILGEIGRTATTSDKVELRLETPVKHIDYSARARQGRGENKVTITTTSGEKAAFDEVVVTAPLGWLKHHHETVFHPALPARLASAISNINYGRLEKLYVTFPSAFWLTDPETGKEDPDRFPIFTHFHDPKYVPHAADEAWNQSVVSLSHLPDSTAQPTLLFYMYGACGTNLVHAVKGVLVHSATYNSILTSFAEPFYSRLPNYSSSDAACQPTSLLVTQWQNDDYAGNGSYCNFQVGLEHGDEDIEVMRDAGGLGASGQGVWLAGEHTAPFIALGTTTGAWWSGEGVARRVCDMYGIRVPEEIGLEERVEKKDLDTKKPDAANLSGLAL